MMTLHTIDDLPRLQNRTSLPFPIGRSSLLWHLSRRARSPPLHDELKQQCPELAWALTVCFSPSDPGALYSPRFDVYAITP